MDRLLVQVLQSERSGNALLSLLDMRSWAVLRVSSPALRHFFSLDKFLEAVPLPLPKGLDEAMLYVQMQWFFALPAFQDDVSRFPHFRVRGAVARLAQGALRSLSMERMDGRLYLVGNIQPAMSWSKAHLVYFEFFPSGLVYRWCRCRNGCVSSSSFQFCSQLERAGRHPGACTASW